VTSRSHPVRKVSWGKTTEKNFTLRKKGDILLVNIDGYMETIALDIAN